MHFDLLPAFAVVGVGLEDKGMAADEFVADGVEHVGRSEKMLFFGNLGIE
jgi:hypothetical protein